MSAGRTIRHRQLPEGDSRPPDDWIGFPQPDFGIERIYRDEAPRLARFFARRVPADDVRDFVQETFRRLIGHRPDRPAAFLTRMAANLVTERRRQAGRRSDALHDAYEDAALAGPDPLRHLEARDAIARIDAALATLKPKTRNIFLLRRVEGMSYAEIAEAYGMSVKGVEKQFAKAMLHVRRHVGER